MLGQRTTAAVFAIAFSGLLVAIIGGAVAGTKWLRLGAAIGLGAVHVMMASAFLMLVRDIRSDIRGRKRVGAIAAYLAIFGGIMVGVVCFQVHAVLKMW